MSSLLTKSILNFPGRRRRVQGPGLVRPLALVRRIPADIRVAVPSFFSLVGSGGGCYFPVYYHHSALSVNTDNAEIVPFFLNFQIT